MKILFCGSDEFAVPALQVLIESPLVELVGVISQPARKVGRKQILQDSDLINFYRSQLTPTTKTKVYLPEKLRELAAEILEETQPELVVVAAYGQIIPDILLNTPQYGCFNIHGSLLPSYRGAVPIEMAILNGEKEVGVSLIKMTKGMDEGDVIAETSLPVSEQDSASTLRPKLATLGAELLSNLLGELANGNRQSFDMAEKQELLAQRTGRIVSNCWKSDLARDKMQLLKSDNSLIWSRKVRAFDAAGGAWCKVLSPQAVLSELKIFEAELLKNNNTNSETETPPELTREGKDLIINFGLTKLKLIKIQLAGKPVSTSEQSLYLANWKII